MECGDILDESQKDSESDMVFTLKEKAPKEKEEKGDDPMWSSAVSAPMDWLYGDE